MNIGRINASKTQNINNETAEEPSVQGDSAAGKDVIELTPPVNDLARALGQENPLDVHGVFQINQEALPKFGETANPRDGQQNEQYGTNTAPGIKLPNEDNRFGINPQEEDPIAEWNRKSGFGFNPQRDLKIPFGDAASISTKDPLRGKSLEEQNKALKEENDALRALHAFDQMQRAIDQLNQQQKELEEKNKAAMEYAQKELDKLKNPNPDAPDNSSGGPNDPLVNIFGSPVKIRSPFVDPTPEQEFGPSGVLIQRNQAVDPNPDADPQEGGAQRAILSSADAVTDPTPDLQTLDQLNKLKGE